MLIVFIVTLVLVGLRLAGNVSVAYQACAHLFLGSLLGYAFATHEWLTILCSIVLCLTEVYMVIAKFVPSIAIGNLLNLLDPKPAPTPKK